MAKKKSLKERATQKKRADAGHWHGGKKSNYSYEGTKYRGGREKDKKNLIRTDTGDLINAHGVTFSPDEKKQLERAVNRVNAKRKRMIEAEGKLPRKSGGKDTGDTVKSLQLMGKESDFIIARKSKSLQQFKTRDDYEKYMKNLDRISSPDYIDERTRMYKRNHIKAIENAFGDEGKDIAMKIRMMKPAEYRELLQSDEMLEVSYIYDPSAREGKLNQIRSSLGMKTKELSYDDEE